MKKRLPKSLRKYIRQEKARIRREILSSEEQEKQIQKLYPVRKPTKQNEDNKNKS